MLNILLTIGSSLILIAMLLLFVIIVLFSVDVIKDELIDLGWIHAHDEDEEE